MIMSPRYVAFARRWLESAGLQAAGASADELAPVVRKAYPGGLRQLKRDADALMGDGMRSCYVGTDERGRPEPVHERHSNGACSCGLYRARV